MPHLDNLLLYGRITNHYSEKKCIYVKIWPKNKNTTFYKAKIKIMCCSRISFQILGTISNLLSWHQLKGFLLFHLPLKSSCISNSEPHIATNTTTEQDEVSVYLKSNFIKDYVSVICRAPISLQRGLILCISLKDRFGISNTFEFQKLYSTFTDANQICIFLHCLGCSMLFITHCYYQCCS